MSSPDSYDDLKLDSAVFHELDLIKATLAASMHQCPPRLINPLSNFPTRILIIQMPIPY